MVGRIIAVPVADNQATSNLKIDLTQLQNLANSWGSSALQQAYQELSLDTDDANSGSLQGNRVFYANDYAVSPHAMWTIRSLIRCAGAAGTGVCHHSAHVLETHAEYGMHELSERERCRLSSCLQYL